MLKDTKTSSHTIGTTEIAWVSGLLEGEGCFTTQKSSGGKYKIRIMCRMTGLDVLEKLQSIIPEATISGPQIHKNPKWKPTWTWSLNKTNIVLRWLKLLYPYMGRRRKDRIIELFDILDKRWRPKKKLGRPRINLSNDGLARRIS